MKNTLNTGLDPSIEHFFYMFRTALYIVALFGPAPHISPLQSPLVAGSINTRQNATGGYMGLTGANRTRERMMNYQQQI